MRQRCQRLEGVDLAPRMVEAARARGIYDHLEVGEVAHYLAAGPADCDLIVAADVTTYIGDLAPLFTAVSAALTPGGRFAATFSDMAEGTFAIGETGTYRHNSDYIDALAKAAGLTVDVIEKGAMRKEAKRPLSTLFYVFRRSDR
jgi:predicted TPR repeat methyltransferase